MWKASVQEKLTVVTPQFRQPMWMMVEHLRFLLEYKSIPYQ
jgi:hypothetical protein